MKLKIGYVSTGFYNAPGTRFFLPVLKNHNFDAVQVYLYAHAPRPDKEMHELRQWSSHWREITKLTNKEAAELIREDGVDILVDLDGQSVGSRLMLFAFKPAPVQVSYHGAFASTGLEQVDYRLVDNVLVPPGELPSGPEQLVRLRTCFYAYCPWPDAPDVTLSPAKRIGHVTFGIMHRCQKWTPIALNLWCRILQAVPGSRVLVNAHDADKYEAKDLAAPFAARGIDRSRITISPRAATIADYLCLYDAVDIFLDSFPFSGATTVCDALWQGVPVVTLRGRSFLGRMGASILTSAFLSGWIADNRQDYVDTAVALAHDVSDLAYWRNALRAHLQESQLWDGKRLARELERTYANLWSWSRPAATK